MSTEKKKESAGCLTLIGMFALMFAWAYVDAYIIHDIWRWYAVPALGVAPISVKAAFGINLLVCVVRAKPHIGDAPENWAFIKAYLQMNSYVLWSWGIAYVVWRWL